MQNTKNKAQKIIRGCAIALSIFSAPAYAGSPVVVEYFGQDGCSDDVGVQQRLHEIVRMRSDVIMLNCRTLDPLDANRSLGIGEKEAKRNDKIEERKQRALEEHGIQVFYNDFCSDRADKYSVRTNDFLRGSSRVIVNGRWISSKYDVMAAVNLGGTDGVKKLDVVREGEILHLTLPEDMSVPKGGEGTLTLFAFAPSSGIDIGKKIDISMKLERDTSRIDSMLDDFKRLVPLEEEEEEKEKSERAEGCASCSISKNVADEAKVAQENDGSEEVPAAKKEKLMQKIFFRPVAAMKEIGVWDGSKMQYDISLLSIEPDSGVDLEKMGYVVVLQDGDRASPVIAAGEVVPSAEQMSVKDAVQ